MNSKNSLLKLLYTSIACCLLLAGFLAGCGGGNNPSGPTVTVPVTSNPVTTSLAPGIYSLVGKVTVDGQAIGGIGVKLYVQDSNTGVAVDSGRTNVSLTSGEFNFNNLSTGTYILRIPESVKYLESSKLAVISTSNSLVSIDTGNLVLFPKSTLNPLTPTLNITGRVVDAVSKNPLSVALISLDSGQTTVSNGFGIFNLSNVEAGTRRMTVSQPGMASFTVSFQVEGTVAPNATGIIINNTSYAVNSGARTVDLTVSGFNIEVSLNPHKNGVLIGTAKKFVLNSLGFATSAQIAFPDYEFDLWNVFPDNTARRFGSVVSNTNGTWRIDNLPSDEDNGALWFAVPVNTTVNVVQGNSGNVIVFSNTSSIWASRDPVLAYGYKVKADQTTIMDFTVPSFAYSTARSSVNAISVAGLSSNANGPFTAVDSQIMSDLYFQWTGPGTSTVVTLEFSRAYKNAAVPVVTKSFNLTDLSPTAVHKQIFKPNNIGLDYGRYSWRTLANDPALSGVQAISDSQLLTIYPSNMDVTPAHNTVLVVTTASRTYDFVAPNDPEATKVVLEFYSGTGAGRMLLGASTDQSITAEATFKMKFSPNAPAIGFYEWRVAYFYPDGPPMYSEFATIEFR